MITLRDARPEDSARVHAWNCAPEVRALSGDPRPVAFAEHTRWYRQRIRIGAMWIIEHAGDPVGVVRIDGNKISIALAAEARGRGIGRHAIVAACAKRREPIVATIHTTNYASRACFEACGFAAYAEGDAFVSYRWSPT